MIDKVHILALKSIKDLSVECSKLNLFWTKTVIFVRRNNYAL